MNIDFYSKYIKYKNKYLILKNNFELKGGASQIKFEPQGANRKLTYLIQDNQGLYHDRLREILNSNGFIELTKQQALAAPNKYVDFFWMGQSNAEGNRFDKELYQIKSTLVTMLWRDKSHTQGKDAITNKQLLYQNMKKYFPNICSKHMAKTYILKDIQSLKDINFFENELSDMTTSSEKTSEDSFTKGEPLNKIYIVKPVGHGACAGVGVTVVTNDKELEEARRELSKRFRNIIVSEYIQNPLLYEGRKFHIRMYILINSDSTWSFWKRGKAMTAKILYKKGDWTNKDIHDSHGETTPKDIYFPEDILPKEKYEYVYQQIELILGAAAKIVKPHVKCYEESKNCCEVFGIDFMITDDYTVKLIEINAEAGYGSKNEDKMIGFTKNHYYQNYLIKVLIK
jgi:tubulin monoglycylase TTLL3/8